MAKKLTVYLNNNCENSKECHNMILNYMNDTFYGSTTIPCKGYWNDGDKMYIDDNTMYITLMVDELMDAIRFTGRSLKGDIEHRLILPLLKLSKEIAILYTIEDMEKVNIISLDDIREDEVIAFG